MTFILAQGNLSASFSKKAIRETKSLRSDVVVNLFFIYTCRSRNEEVFCKNIRSISKNLSERDER